MTISRSLGLSVCCLTSHAPAIVACTLAMLRDVANEIVVAVDSRIDPSQLAPLADVADTLVRFEFVDRPELARPWLVGLCRNRSVLMIDGDEVPSTALIDRLPMLVSDDSVVQFRLARRWCFPDERRWLAERPWWPDYQRRLIRVGPELDFDLRVHGGVREALPARYVDEPLYHLACVLASFAERRQRVRRYVALRPGLVAVGGGPMNDTLYVPEHFATLQPESTPAEDVGLLRSVVLAAKSSQPTSDKWPDLPLVTAEEIVSCAPADPLEAQGYRARLRVVERDRRTEPGNNTLVGVEVTNCGFASLPRRDSWGAQLRVATRLIDPGTGAGAVEWAFTPLPCDIPPGEPRSMEVLVRIPDAPGVYVMEVDLVNEGVRSFGCLVRADLLVATRWGRYAPVGTSADRRSRPK